MPRILRPVAKIVKPKYASTPPRAFTKVAFLAKIRQTHPG
jgi:hypothetical protein